MNNKYVVTRPVFTNGGACVRRDEVVVHEKDLLSVLTVLTSEPWFSKVTIKKYKEEK